MPVQTIYALGASNITVSGGQQLSGITQGDGSHLAGETITLNNNDWEAVDVLDTEANFQDSDSSQQLEGAQDFDGNSYADNLRVEAEYRLVLEDPDGNQYEVLGFNINEPGVTSYSTVEGLAFVGGEGGFPPTGVPLTVISTHEGPSVGYDELAAPPCFTRGCLIDTPDGAVPVETLKAGDLVQTVFNGAQKIRWIGTARLPSAALADHPNWRPVRISAGALGQGLPKRDLIVSRQHRLMVSSQIVERMFGLSAVLVAAHRFCDLPGVQLIETPQDIEYFHILFDQHEVVLSEGAPTESLYIGPEAQKFVPAATLQELFELFPTLQQHAKADTSGLPIMPPAREKNVAARHIRNGKPVLEGFCQPS